MKQIILVLFVTLGILNLHGQTTWSLIDCINYAYENNLQIKMQEITSQVASNNKKQAVYNFLPDLNAGAGMEISSGRAIDDFTNDFTNSSTTIDLGINSNTSVFEGFMRYHTYLMEDYKLMASVQDLEVTKDAISLSIAAAFLQILLNQELLEVASEQLKVSQQQVARAQRLVEVGNLAKGDLFEVKAQVSQEKYILISNANSVKNSYLELIQLLDLDSIGDFLVVQPDTFVVEDYLNLMPVRDIYNISVQAMPEIKSAEHYVKASEHQLGIARSDLYPTLSMNVGHGTGYSSVLNIDNTYTFSDQIRDNASTYVGFRLGIPIFNRLGTYTNIQNAKLGLKNQQLVLQQQKQILYKKIQQARTDALAAYEKYKSSLEVLVSYEESFKYTEQKFNVGMATSIDYNVAKTNLSRSESEVLQAKYEFIFKSKILDFYMGKPLSI